MVIIKDANKGIKLRYNNELLELNEAIINGTPISRARGSLTEALYLRAVIVYSEIIYIIKHMGIRIAVVTLIKGSSMSRHIMSGIEKTKRLRPTKSLIMLPISNILRDDKPALYPYSVAPDASR